MRAIKIMFFAVAGAVCGVVLMYLLMPLISHIFIGPVHGEDQMSLNFATFVTGSAVLAVAGAVTGGFIAARKG